MKEIKLNNPIEEDEDIEVLGVNVSQQQDDDKPLSASDHKDGTLFQDRSALSNPLMGASVSHLNVVAEQQAQRLIPTSVSSETSAQQLSDL